MSGGKAKVHTIDALREFRPALVKFEEACRVALISAESDAGRVIARLRGERLGYWKKELRRREEVLTRVRSEISMRAVMRGPEHRATVDDRKAEDRARAAVEEARQKLEVTRFWIRALEKESDAFSGGVQPLKSAAAADVPRALADLDRMAGALEAYVAIGAPSRRGPAEGGGEGGA